MNHCGRAAEGEIDPKICVWRGLACAEYMNGCPSPVNDYTVRRSPTGRHEWVTTMARFPRRLSPES
jgi:hypothetical protein